MTNSKRFFLCKQIVKIVTGTNSVGTGHGAVNNGAVIGQGTGVAQAPPGKCKLPGWLPRKFTFVFKFLS